MRLASIKSLAETVRHLAPDAGTLPRALMGDADERSLERCPYSELQLAEPPNWGKGLQTLSHLLIPASSRRPPRWVRHQPRLKPAVRLLRRPAKVFHYHDSHDWPDPTPDQAWFFLNGIGADRHVLMLNAAYLSHLFGRPLTLLHNPSCGLLADLSECLFDRGGRGIADATRVAFAPLYVALKQKRIRRVVVIAHSQGTVVTAALLWLLRALYAPTAAEALHGEAGYPEQAVAQRLARKWGFPPPAEAARRARRGSAAIRPPLSCAELAKLEIYAFANCASTMTPIDKARSLPFIESYGNQHDALAHQGVLSTPPDRSEAPIGGERYWRPGAWGHWLNAHYLHPLERDGLSLRRDGRTTEWVGLPGNRLAHPRLLDYLDGQTPPRRVA